jgi:hypothetical protein
LGEVLSAAAAPGADVKVWRGPVDTKDVSEFAKSRQMVDR